MVIPDVPTLLHALRDHAAGPRADAPAVVRWHPDADDEVWTTSELVARVQAVAAQLRTVAQPGDRVLLLAPQGPWAVAGLLGAMWAGVLAVPMQRPGVRRAPAAWARLATVSKDAGVVAVAVVADDLQPLQDAADGGLGDLPWLAFDAGEPADVACAEVTPDDLAYLQYTSGSTSDPKGVMVSHGNLMTNLATFDVDFGHGTDTVVVSWLPTYHDLGCVYGVLLPLVSGFPSVLFDPLEFVQHPITWLQALSDWKGTHTAAPDFAFARVGAKVRPDDLAGLSLDQVTVILNGAEPIRRSSESAFLTAVRGSGIDDRTIRHAYGMSEATAVIAKEPLGAAAAFLEVDAEALRADRVVPVAGGAPIASCGVPVDPTTVLAVDPETCVPCPPDTVGELWVGGPTRGQGYWNRPESTRAGFFAEAEGHGRGWLRTGDLGFVCDGCVYVTGRLKDLVIVRGANHYPQDLEAAVAAAHRSIRPGGVVVAGVSDDDGEGAIVLCEVPSADEATDEVIEVVREAVAAEGVPVRRIALLGPRAIPKTTSGKLMRRQALADLTDGSTDVLRYWAPDATVAALDAADDADLVAVILSHAAHALGVPAEALDADLPFRDLGLDSVQAVDLLEALGARLGRSLPVTMVFDHPTARDLAAALGGTTPPTPEPPAVSEDDGADDLEGLDAASLAALIAGELGDVDET